jgi:hypothetical protein
VTLFIVVTLAKVLIEVVVCTRRSSKNKRIDINNKQKKKRGKEKRGREVS